MKTIPNVTTRRPADTPYDAEHDLIAGVFRQALADLNPTAEPAAHAAAVRWWQNRGGELQWWCVLAGLDMHHVQRAVAQRYPEVWAPRQLELHLGVA